MSHIKELLGRRIKEIRISKKITQEQLSELTNIGASSISKIESGIYHPSDDNLEKNTEDGSSNEEKDGDLQDDTNKKE